MRILLIFQMLYFLLSDEPLPTAVVADPNNTSSRPATGTDVYKRQEFNKLGVSKGSGLKKLAELLGVPMECVMAIGDGGNDAEMLRAAGVGVAMENAMEEARAAADYITADVRKCGVAQAIDRFVFGK